MVDVLAAPQQTKTDAALRTLVAISTAHWVSHFHMFVLPMLFPFLKEQLCVGYIELGFAFTTFGVVAGAVGPLVALLLLVVGIPDASAADRHVNGVKAPRQNIITPTLIVLTIFFMLLGLSNAGIATFGVVALMSGYDVSFSAANIALTAFLGISALAVLAVGFLADHTQRHGQVAAACFAINAVIVCIIAVVALPSLLLMAAMALAGFLGGVIAPSRDMMVRNAAPPGAAGRAFGIVSTGFNLSGVFSPLLFGWIMDQNMPHWVFGASVIFMTLTVLLALFTEHSPQAGPAEADARLMQP